MGKRIGQVIGAILGVLLLLAACTGGGILWLLGQHGEVCQAAQQEALDKIQAAANTHDRVQAEGSARIVLANPDCFPQRVQEEVIQDYPDIAASYAPTPSNP